MTSIFNAIGVNTLITGSGITIRSPVRVATTVNGNFSTAYEPSSIVDGVSLIANDRILIKDQSLGNLNGIYVVQNSGAPIRAEDLLDGSSASTLNVTVREGTINRQTTWVCTSPLGSDVVGIDTLIWSRAGGKDTTSLASTAVPASNKVVRFNGTDGSLRETPLLVDNSGNTSGFGNITMTGATNNLVLAASDQTSGIGTFTFPDLGGVSGSAVVTNLAQTLTNKTLTNPTISSINNGGTINIPSGTDIFATLGATQSLVNKSLVSSFNVDSGDQTKRIGYNIGGATTGTTTTLVASQTADRSLTLPNLTDTLVSRTSTDTLTNKTLTSPVIATISNGGAITVPSGPGTFATIAATQTLTNKTMTGATNTLTASLLKSATTEVSVAAATAPTVGQVLTATSSTTATWQTSAAGVTPSSVDTFTNKSFVDASCLFIDDGDDTKRLMIELGGATTSTTTTLTASQTADRVVTLPNATDTLVGRNTTDTLTNKTLTQPIISVISNTGLLTLPTSTDTLVARDTTDTLTNKTLSSPVIAAIVNGGTLTVPNATDTLVARNTTDSLTNKNLVDASCFIVDDGNATRRLGFELGGATGATTTTFVLSQTGNRSITFPNVTDTLVARTTTDTLTNKTLTAPVIATISNTGTLTLPTSTDTLVARNTTDSFTNKSFVDASCFFVDDDDATKRLSVELSGATTSTTTQLVFSQTANRFLTFPNITDTIVTRTNTETLTNKTLTTPIIASISNTGTLTLPTSTDTLVARNTTDTLTNKTLTSPIISTISNTGTLTLPTNTDTLVGRSTTDTLTNKTLTAPVIATISNTGTLTLPTSTDTLVARNTTDTLTNKTMTGATNTLTASLLKSATTEVSVSAATAPTNGQVLTATSSTTATWQTPTGITASSTDSFTNKSFVDASCLFVDDGDATKRQAVQLGGATTGTTTTLTFSQTANRAITFPDVTDTLVARTTTDTLTNKTLTAPIIATISNTGTLTLPTSTDTLVGRATTDTLTNKTLTAPIISTISNTGTLTLPTATDTLVGRATTDTLTNKRLVDLSNFFVDNADITKRQGMSLSGATTGTTTTLIFAQTVDRSITFPNTTDTLVARATTDTLTNKTMTGATNTLTASLLKSATTEVSVSAATAPSAGQVLTATSSTVANWQTPSGITASSADDLTNKNFVDASCFFVDDGDTTKRQNVQLNGATTGTTTTLVFSQTADRLITFPNITDTLVSRTSTDILTNKTLTAPVIATISNTGTLTLPTSTDTLVARNTTDTLTNKTLTAPIISTISNTGTLTLPTSTDTLVARNTTDTLTNKTLTAPVISTIVNTGTLTLPTSTDTLVGRATSDTFTNKNFTDTNCFFVDNGDVSKRFNMELAGSTTGATTTFIISSSANRSITLPNLTDTLVSRTNTETLTNKTLTAPVIATIVNTGTLTLPTSTDTLVARATTDTLTNKTLTGATNTIAASQLRTTGADVVVSTAAPPTTGQVLTATSATNAEWVTPAQTQDNNANTGTITNGNMAGLGALITPIKSGAIFIIAVGSIFCNSNNATTTVEIRTGTGAAPVANSAATGTVRGPVIRSVNTGTGTSYEVPFTCAALVTGLTLNTQIWIDLRTTNTGGNMTLRVPSITAIEL